ncbi:hypothetical protein [Brevibacillus laterosporus]|uniref:Uncharacterized protein n=1 Tax=Brevibacillus laterosporus TaxID=1465 RepID=A0AAP3DI34_BRELA|nr:hypothetical protein [Brevibacillus laterosporus]MCR8980907.1 hypothetical protein [Brevibacillus laterosporus]MCZ0808062.1 hypothetical protein [Brevibacillus laterosporus]MCZ0826254.1 hypothetical protein [Brevibacillus laterosporus]MCZ0850137.1 hypothetical protein [Brevibacillus laterosporus]
MASTSATVKVNGIEELKELAKAIEDVVTALEKLNKCTSKRNTVTVSPVLNITTAQVDAVSTKVMEQISDELTDSLTVFGNKI